VGTWPVYKRLPYSIGGRKHVITGAIGKKIENFGFSHEDIEIMGEEEKGRVKKKERSICMYMYMMTMLLWLG